MFMPRQTCLKVHLGGGVSPKTQFCFKEVTRQKMENRSDTKIFNVDRELTQKVLRSREKISARKPPKNRFWEVPNTYPPPSGTWKNVFITIPNLETFRR